MEIFRFNVEEKLVEKGLQEGGELVRVSNACPCGCAEYPFVSLSDGEVGLTVRFHNEEELEQFKAQVRVLQMPWANNCRYCQHLVTVSKPKEKWIGGCDLRLRPKDCGKFELASCLDGHDPRHESLKGEVV